MLAIFWVASIFCVPVQASSLRVAPISIEVSPPASASLMRLENSGAQPLAAQVRAFRWTQVDGEDLLEPTDAIAVSPPVSNIEAGAEQVIRVVRTLETPVDEEESYRLLIDELPDSASKPGGPALRMLIRYSVPVFFNKGTPSKSALSWRAAREEDGVVLIAHNPGSQRVRLTQLNVDSAGKTLKQGGDGLAGYVLAGMTRHWTLPLDAEQKAALGPSLDIRVHDGLELRQIQVPLAGDP